MSERLRIELLERLSRLHAAGDLTDAEFAAQKAALMKDEVLDSSSNSAPNPSSYSGGDAEAYHETAASEAYYEPEERVSNWPAALAFIVLYLLALAPTYALPYLGSNSLVLTWVAMELQGEGTSFLDANPAFFLHAGWLIILILLSAMRGQMIGKGWIAIFPIIAAAFDLSPGLSMVPMVPTVMHVTAMIIGGISPVADDGRGIRARHIWLVGILLIAAITIVEFTLESRQENLQNNTGDVSQEEEDYTEPSPTWSLSSSIDPLTDAEVSKATAEFEVASGFLVNTSISCEANRTISYQFALFDSNRSPVSFRSTDYLNDGGPAIGFTMRLDDGKAHRYLSYDTQFSNVIQFDSKETGGFIRALAALSSGALTANAEKAAKAHRLVLRFPLSTGDVTLELDQTDADLRSVLDPCLENLTREEQAREAEVADRYRRLREESSAASTSSQATPRQPTEPTPQNSSSWITPEDYPARPLFGKRPEGNVGIFLTVDSEGSVADCEVTRSSGNADLDSRSCALVSQRARFRPATDSQGQNTDGSWEGTIVW